MGAVKGVLALIIVAISAWKFHKYEDEYGDMEMWRALLWYGLTGVAGILILLIPTK